MLYAGLGAILIGVCLGLLGSGGAIITVPLLVYLVGHAEKQAIAESLLIVGAISLAGALHAGVKNRLSARHVVLMGLPGMVGAFLGALAAKFISGPVQLVLLSLVMLVASAVMFRGRPQSDERPAVRQRAWILMAQGLGVGVLTGLLGVGGGFLLVPTLVLLARLPMSLAVGTSLGIIALNCVTGFAKSWHALERFGLAIDWRVCAVFIGLGVVGIVVGTEVGGRMNQRLLRRIFAVFLVVMAVYIFVKEWPHAMAEPIPASLPTH